MKKGKYFRWYSAGNKKSYNFNFTFGGTAVLVGASMYGGHRLWKNMQAWYYDFPVVYGVCPQVTELIENEKHTEFIKRLSDYDLSKSNTYVLHGGHGYGKSISARYVFHHPEEWWQAVEVGPLTRFLLPIFTESYQNKLSKRDKPWLKAWMSVPHVHGKNEFSAKDEMFNLAKHVHEKRFSSIVEHPWRTSIFDGIKFIMNYFNLGGLLYKFEVPEFVQHDKDQSLNNLKLYLEAYPGWVIVFDNIDKYQQVQHYLPSYGGVVIISTNNSDLANVATRGNSIEYGKFTHETAKRYCRKYLPEDQLDDDIVIEQLVDKLARNPLGMKQACSYIKSTKRSISSFLKMLENPDNIGAVFDTTLANDVHENIVKTINASMDYFDRNYISSCPEKQLLSIIGALAVGPLRENLLKRIFDEIYKGRRSYRVSIDKLVRFNLVERVNDNTIQVHELTHMVLIAYTFKQHLKLPFHSNWSTYWRSFIPFNGLSGDYLLNYIMLGILKEMAKNYLNKDYQELDTLHPHITQVREHIETNGAYSYRLTGYLPFLIYSGHLYLDLNMYTEAAQFFDIVDSHWLSSLSWLFGMLSRDIELLDLAYEFYFDDRMLWFNTEVRKLSNYPEICKRRFWTLFPFVKMFLWFFSFVDSHANITRAILEGHIASYSFALMDFVSARDQLIWAINGAEKSGVHKDKIAVLYFQLARVYVELGQYNEAVSEFKNAINTLSFEGATHKNNLAIIFKIYLADVYFKQHKYNEALDIIMELKEEQLKQIRYPIFPVISSNMEMIMAWHNLSIERIDFQDIFPMIEAGDPGVHSDMDYRIPPYYRYSVKLAVGIKEYVKKNYALAKEAFQDSKTLLELYPIEHPIKSDIANFYISICDAFITPNETAIVPAFRYLIKIEEYYGNNHIDLADKVEMLADWYSARNNKLEAQRFALKSIYILRQHLDEDHKDITRMLKKFHHLFSNSHQTGIKPRSSVVKRGFWPFFEQNFQRKHTFEETQHLCEIKS